MRSPLLPQRRSLVADVGEILATQMSNRRWGEWLPQERELARELQVSRFTLRRALELLRKRGLVETQHGVGTRARAGRGGRLKPPPNQTVGVLLPRSLETFRHFATLVVDDLKSLLFDRGFTLVLHDHPQVAARVPARLLTRLVAQHRHACWILVACGVETQRWFCRQKLPVVVSGTCEPSLGLPSVCLDNHALGRHAALTLRRLGHREIGALLTHTNPGLRDGLEEIVGGGGEAGGGLLVAETDDDPLAVARAVDRLLARAPVPTAFFIAESSFYLAVSSRLAQRGLRVPEDVSLLCRDDEPYLAWLRPTPARYSKSPHQYARLLLAHLAKVIDQEPIAQLATPVMPEFIAGQSLRRME